MKLEECYLITGIGIVQEGDEYKMVMVHHSAIQPGHNTQKEKQKADFIIKNTSSGM
jgi:cold shock CspA family protein